LAAISETIQIRLAGFEFQMVRRKRTSASEEIKNATELDNEQVATSDERVPKATSRVPSFRRHDEREDARNESQNGRRVFR